MICIYIYIYIFIYLHISIIPISSQSCPPGDLSRLVHHDLPIIMAGCAAGRDDWGLQTWSEASCTSSRGGPPDMARQQGLHVVTMSGKKKVSWDLVRYHIL